MRAVGRQVQERGTGALDGGAYRQVLVRVQVVHDDDVAGRQGGDQELLDIGLGGQAMIGPSTTQGAVRALQRNAARKVMVCQWPCGTAPIARWPRGARP